MTVRAVMIGLGAIGQRHARNLRALLGDDLELAAVRSKRGGKVITDDLTIGDGSPEDDFNGGIYTDLKSALDTRPDLVFVCTPSNMHVEAAIRAVECGAAVFIEKPLSSDMTGVEKLLESARNRNAVVAIGCQLRFHPALRRLRALVESGAIGQILAVHVEQGEYLPSFHPYEDYRESYAARSDLGGGVIVTQIHEIDYLYWLFGMPTRVFAVGGKLGELEIDVEDSVSALFEYSRDERQVAVHVHLDYLQRPPRRTCRIVGTAGVLDLDLRAPLLQHFNANGQIVEENRFPEHDRTRMFRSELTSFLEAARGEHPPEVDLVQAIEALKMAEAMKLSLETKQVHPIHPS